MSYILDALKKSDEQRQRGATPTLPSTQPAPAAPKLSYFGYYGAYAAVLLFAGIGIGWWHPWQEEQPERATERLAARPVMPNIEQATIAPRAEQPEMAGKPEQRLPAPATATVDQEQKATTLSDLPLAIQQELPEMKIQLHSYSSKSANSIVSINSRMMKEGDSLAPGLVLEQITPDGVILSYKGYRFQHGIY